MRPYGKAALVVTAFAFVAGLAAPAQAAAQYKIKWLLGHNNLDYFAEAAYNFKHIVETKSRGDISVEVVTAPEGGTNAAETPGPDVAGAVAAGEAEMGHSFVDVVGRLDSRFLAFEAPYLFRDYRHLEGVFEGPVGAEMLDGLRAHQIVGLSFTYSGGSSGITTLNRELRRPEDLKGLKVGVYADSVNAAWLRALGATPVLMEHGNAGALALARDGKIDAAVTTWRNFQRPGLNQAFQHVDLMGSTYLVSVTYVNEKFFRGLPKEYQRLLREATVSTSRIERAKTIELNEQSKRQMMAKGVRAAYLSNADKSRFVETLRPVYDGPLAGLLDKKFVKKLRDTGDGPAQPSIPEGLARWSSAADAPLSTE